MPLGPIVDSHVHLWDPTHFRMSWLDGNDLLDKPYGLDDYRTHTQGVDVESIVYLQVEVNPPYSLLEAKWVADLETEKPTIGAIVPWAPLEDGERARSFLDAMVAIDPRIRGIRRLYQDEPNIDFCVQPDFIRGCPSTISPSISASSTRTSGTRSSWCDLAPR
jgi:L-fuconolactonase